MSLQYSTNRIVKLENLLKDIALNSDISRQHSAVILYNGNIVAHGINSIRGNKSIHAEPAAIRQFLLSRGLIGWIKKQCILWGSHKQYWGKGTKEYIPYPR
jgi:pyrimidine deaminase RibD-like protein